MTGFYEPNAGDITAGHTAGFGSTILLAANGGCGADAQARQDSFDSFSEDLGLNETENLSCVGMWPAFNWSGSSNKLIFFARDWSGSGCKIVSYATAYSAFEHDGYKQCVCTEFNLMDEP